MDISVLAILFYVVWYFYGIDLMFNSAKACGKEMYTLSFVLFWILIGVLGCACCS